MDDADVTQTRVQYLEICTIDMIGIFISNNKRTRSTFLDLYIMLENDTRHTKIQY